MHTGTIFSGIGHAGLILWVLVGDWLFPARPTEDVIVTSVSMVTSAEFDAMQAAATLKPADEPAPVKPEPRPEEVTPPEEVVPEEPAPVEPVPEEPVPEEPAPEPAPVEEPLPVEEVVPVEPPPSDVPQAEEEQAIQSESTEIQPAPEAEEIIAPDPVQPETEADRAETATPAVTEDPEATEVVIEEPTEATVPEDTGKITKTEENQDQTEETGMMTSVRPKSRPEKPAPAPEPVEVAADVPESPEEPSDEDPAEQPVDDTATEDAIAVLLDEAADAPATEETAADTGGQDLPQGPPLSGSEMSNISSAIARKWNLGTASTDAMSSMVVLRVTFGPSGEPLSFELIESSGPSETGIKTLYQTAERAIRRAHTDGGLQLPAEKYDSWSVLDMVFDASGLRAR